MNKASCQYQPTVVYPPGETLQEMLDERGWSQAELARRMSRPAKTINEIIKGKAAITPETALQLERTIGPSAGYWMNSERHFQEFKARLHERDELQAYSSWMKELPLAELIRNKWIAKFNETADQVREVLKFFGIASPIPWDQLGNIPASAFRAAQSFKSNPAALAAWLRQGELEAQKIVTVQFDELRLRGILPTLRELTLTSQEEFVAELARLCSSCGLAVVFVPEVSGVRASGVARWLSDGVCANKAVIQLSLRYKSNDHFWFTFFHEIGHILLHGKRLMFVDFDIASKDQDKHEREANEFAAVLLIPVEDFSALLSRGDFSEAALRGFARKIGIHVGIVIGRLQHEDKLDWNTKLNKLKQKLRWN